MSQLFKNLKNELNYYNIDIINSLKVKVYDEKDKKYKIKFLNDYINDIEEVIKGYRKDIKISFNYLFDILNQHNTEKVLNDDIKKIFKSMLKDLSIFLSAFDMENSDYFKLIENTLNRDINSFSKKQIENVIDIKNGIDFYHRMVTRFLYIRKLLVISSKYKYLERDGLKMKQAAISGPWANLDLPMEERVWEYDDWYLRGRMKDKQKQRRYTKGLKNYNNDGRVGEGHYWRELRNEPYSWENIKTDSPYPRREYLW